MLSLILYGRNDSYGYNLHKRAAISLNCMAEMLTAPDDEILFVDYNTPDDFPTFPEAIQDTLTARAKALLRILRVRPNQHEPFRKRTGLMALEPIARNVALRRSNPANRWVLSTNTDMVFVPQRGRSLSEIVADLPDAYYPLPRFEVPETLWESADRLNPQATIAAFGDWGRTFHLNEIVLGADPIVMYDAPGDFQLALRTDLWRMHGFHEGMLLGWHVDSNLAKRLALLPQRAGDVLDDVFGYHCDHTRQVTPAHRPRAAENDLQVFFEEVTSAELPEQADTWGLAGQTVEEISVNTTSRLYVEALQAATPAPMAGPTPSLHYEYSHHNRIDYAVDHVLPFIADAVASYHRDTLLAWFGSKRTLLEHFALAWRTMGFTKNIMVPAGARWLGPDLPAGCVWTPEETMVGSAEVLLFDWGRRDEVAESDWDFRSDDAVRATLRGLRKSVREERRRFAAKAGRARRFVAINAVNNDAERIFHDLVGAARTPIATRIRQGYVSDLFQPQEMLAALNAGAAGRKISGNVVAAAGTAGCVFYVLPMFLDRGTYRLRLAFEASGSEVPDVTGLGLEVLSRSCLLHYRPVTPEELRAGVLSFEFDIPTSAGGADDWPETEFLMHTIGRTGLVVRSALLEQLVSSDVEPPATEFDFLPLLSLGPAGEYRPCGVQSKPGVEAFLVYGPHLWLLPGRYEAAYEFVAPAVKEQRGIEARIEIVAAFGHRLFAEAFVDFTEHGIVPDVERQQLNGVLAFDVRTDAPPHADGLLECRVWSGGGDVCLSALRICRVGDPSPVDRPIERFFGGRLDTTREAVARRVQAAYVERLPPADVLWLSQVGPAGKREISAIEALPGVFGVLAHGPYLWFLPGRYEVTFEIRADDMESDDGELLLEVVSEMGNRVLATQTVQGKWSNSPLERLRGARSKTLLYTLPFAVATDVAPVESGLLEFRVWTSGSVRFALTALRVRQVETGAVTDASENVDGRSRAGSAVDPIRGAVAQRVREAHREHLPPPDVLPLLQVGSAGKRGWHAIEAVPGEAGVMAHGPYIRLQPGKYEVTFELDAVRAASGNYVKLEVVADLGNTVLAHRLAEPHWRGRRFERLTGRRSGKLRYALAFDVTPATAASEGGELEFRVWAPGMIPFKLTSVTVSCVDALQASAEETVPRSP